MEEDPLAVGSPERAERRRQRRIHSAMLGKNMARGAGGWQAESNQGLDHTIRHGRRMSTNRAHA